MKRIELSNNDKKTLNTFSMYLQSYGSKVGRYRIEVGTDGDVYWDYSQWSGDGTRMHIESYDKIDDLIGRIFKENEELMLENFSSDDRGGIEVVLNTNNKTLSFVAEVVVYSVQYSSNDYTFDEIDNQNIKNWFSEMENSYTSGTIHYEGSGDSGYIDSVIIFDDDTRSDYSSQLEDWMYRQLSQYGGWEINEGSQGDFHFNFDRKTVKLSHGENYEEEETKEIPLIIEF